LRIQKPCASRILLSDGNHFQSFGTSARPLPARSVAQAVCNLAADIAEGANAVQTALRTGGLPDSRNAQQKVPADLETVPMAHISATTSSRSNRNTSSASSMFQ